MCVPRSPAPAQQPRRSYALLPDNPSIVGELVANARPVGGVKLGGERVVAELDLGRVLADGQHAVIASRVLPEDRVLDAVVDLFLETLKIVRLDEDVLTEFPQ